MPWTMAIVVTVDLYFDIWKEHKNEEYFTNLYNTDSDTIVR